MKKLFKFPDYSDLPKRIELLSKALGVWVILVTLSNLIYSEYIYDFDLFLNANRGHYLVSLFRSLPVEIIKFIESKPFVTSITAIIIAAFTVYRNNLYFSFILMILVKLQYLLASSVRSGATALVSTLTAYIFLFYLLESIRKLNPYRNLLYKCISHTMALQIFVVYMTSGLSKLISPLWRSGAAPYYIFNVDRYAKIEFISEMVSRFKFISYGMTISTFLALLIVPFLLFTLHKRKALFILSLFHLFNCLHMGLREFMIFPIVDTIIFLSALEIGSFWSLFKKKSNRPIMLR